MQDRRSPRIGLILSLNSGSSSLKISLYRLSSAQPPVEDHQLNPVSLIITSSISSISSTPAFSFSVVDTSLVSSTVRDVNNEPASDVHDHSTAFAHFLNYLEKETGVDRQRITQACHRIVHGGDYYKPEILTEESYHYIERLSDLAPLHNGTALSVIEACITHLPRANSIAYFDTTFHRAIPAHIASCAIDQEVANKKGLKKYGFHGLSYGYILRAVSRYLEKNPSETNLIVMHLGSGASVCAIQNGQSLDTSMGLTPVSGLPGATRSGALDATLIFHYTHRAGRISHDKSLATPVGVTEAENILNTKSGWSAMTGTTDFGVVTSQRSTDSKSALAFDLFVDRILDYVGAYYVKLGARVDALVFSGGIGECGAELREAVVERCACIGFVLDRAKNNSVDGVEGKVVEIGVKEKGEKRVLVCRTDEQLEMARQCALNPEFWE
ncbi:hypothetical protein EW146_g4849 [Bondarzewia mesenterica]|uniref:Probable acetate kinase n=1 Tax=Bondarzewia mesenterica TaxID=1095465 RepID=A0A4S4LYZ9_9AGAM|nr:hypothetical protein EW146_g4849 [Bondarzewia mesenterica]